MERRAIIGSWWIFFENKIIRLLFGFVSVSKINYFLFVTLGIIWNTKKCPSYRETWRSLYFDINLIIGVKSLFIYFKMHSNTSLSCWIFVTSKLVLWSGTNQAYMRDKNKHLQVIDINHQWLSFHSNVKKVKITRKLESDIPITIPNLK